MIDVYETCDAALAAYIWAFHADGLAGRCIRNGRVFFQFALAPGRGEELALEFANSQCRRFVEYRRRVLDEVHRARRATGKA